MDEMLYWEDFAVGQARDLGRTQVSREEILAFARQFDPQPFHLDEEAARASVFGGLGASGWHTCGLAMRLMVQNFLCKTASLGSPGLDKLQWLKPVHPGDELHLTHRVIETRPMRSRPEVGLVRTHWNMHNQRGEQVLHMDGWSMFRRRPVPA